MQCIPSILSSISPGAFKSRVNLFRSRCSFGIYLNSEYNCSCTAVDRRSFLEYSPGHLSILEDSPVLAVCTAISGPELWYSSQLHPSTMPRAAPGAFDEPVTPLVTLLLLLLPSHPLYIMNSLDQSNQSIS